MKVFNMQKVTQQTESKVKTKKHRILVIKNVAKLMGGKHNEDLIQKCRLHNGHNI